jgi:site-specific DNA-methyltransferase (adenine-specific)
MVKPYYDEDGITIYHGDCREVLPLSAEVLVTDPPYGIGHESGWENALPAIVGDRDTSLRDAVLSAWSGPALVFGSWRRDVPVGAHTCLVWDKGLAAGMGDLSVPWKPNWEAIYVIGRGFSGTRDTSVLSGHTVVTWNGCSFGRQHPNEKPVSLLTILLLKCPAGSVLDPFMGSGSTLRAAKDLGRRAIGIEIEERYCEIAAKRLAQRVLPLAMNE